MTTLNAADFWNRAARKYSQSKISDVPAYEQTLVQTLSHLGADDRVLELGCGTGSTALRLAPAVGTYLGTDIAATMIEIAREKAWTEGVDGLSFADTAYPVADGPWTRILAFNLLHLLPDLDADLARIHSDLAPDGLFISKTPCLVKRWYLRPMVKAMQLVGKAPWVAFLSTDDLTQRIKAAGFEIVETGLYPPKVPSLFIVARKR